LDERGEQLVAEGSRERHKASPQNKGFTVALAAGDFDLHAFAIRQKCASERGPRWKGAIGVKHHMHLIDLNDLGMP